MRCLMLASISLLAAGSVASAGVTVSLGSSAPTYAQTLNFDESGGATGSVIGNEWAGIGVSNLVSGVGDGFVGDLSSIFGFPLGTGNAFAGTYGALINFSSNLTEFSAQYWDSSGPADFLSGGALVVAVDHGTEVGSFFLDNPAWDSGGDTWINITTDGGSTFDEVRFVGFGWVSPVAVIDDLSWNAVPAPSAAALLPLAALAASRRRRA